MTSGGWKAAGGTDCRSAASGVPDPSEPPLAAAVVAGRSGPSAAAGSPAAGSACFAAADLADLVLVARVRVALAGAPSSPPPAGLLAAGVLPARLPPAVLLAAGLSPAEPLAAEPPAAGLPPAAGPPLVPSSAALAALAAGPLARLAALDRDWRARGAA